MIAKNLKNLDKGGRKFHSAKFDIISKNLSI